MATEVIFPRVDMDMESGKITQWFVAEGEPVAKGKPLFEIETDKAAMEIEAPAGGVLRGVSRQLGETLAVGAVVGWICAPDEVFEAPKAASSAVDAAEPAPKLEPADISVSQEASVAGDGGVRATPKARRLAHERGYELSALKGSGPNGRIQARDVGEITATAARNAGDRLHGEWLAQGSGAPVVFIHGFGADLNGWRPLQGHLSPGRGHFALDLPGHGLSDLAGAATLEALVAAVEATLDAEGIGAAHLVAHSLGGAVAAAYAAKLPTRVRSLTLLSSAGLGPEFNGAFAKGFLDATSAESLAPWLGELVVDPAVLGAAMVKATLKGRAKRPLVETQRRIAAGLFPDGTQAISVRAALARYAGPTRLVFGIEDRVIPASQARGLPGTVALHLLPGIGHMPHFEARALTAAIVEDNIAAGDRRAG